MRFRGLLLGRDSITEDAQELGPELVQICVCALGVGGDTRTAHETLAFVETLASNRIPTPLRRSWILLASAFLLTLSL